MCDKSSDSGALAFTATVKRFLSLVCSHRESRENLDRRAAKETKEKE